MFSSLKHNLLQQWSHRATSSSTSPPQIWNLWLAQSLSPSLSHPVLSNNPGRNLSGALEHWAGHGCAWRPTGPSASRCRGNGLPGRPSPRSLPEQQPGVDDAGHRRGAPGLHGRPAVPDLLRWRRRRRCCWTSSRGRRRAVTEPTRGGVRGGRGGGGRRGARRWGRRRCGRAGTRWTSPWSLHYVRG
jgi:hypothetical protein